MKDFLQAVYPVRDQDGVKSSLSIKIYRPEKDPESLYGDYYCYFEITGPQLDSKSKAFGIDPFQAFWLALKRIKDLVHGYEYKQNMRVEYFFDA